MSFSLFVPKFRCNTPMNHSFENQGSDKYISKDQCNYKLSPNSSWIKCSEWMYEREILNTSLIMEFNLVCDREYYRELLLTIYFVGGLACYPLAMVSDILGRRLILLTAVYLSVIFTIWQVFAKALWEHFFLLFVTGFLKSTYIALAYTSLIELMSINRLDIAACNFWIFYAINYMLCSPFSYLGRSWRVISIFSLSLSIFYLFYLCFIPETPRWLMLNQKRDKSYKVLSFIAKINSRKFQKNDIDDWKPIQEKTGKFWNLFKHKIMIYRLLLLNFAGWTFAFAYIGSSTDLTFASDNIFITTFVMGAVELPNGPISGFLSNKYGRKKSIYLLCSLGIFGFFIIPFLESDVTISVWQPWLKVTFAMLAKLGFSCAWSIFDIVINELLPTTDRNSGNAIVYLGVSLGSIIAPMLQKILVSWSYAAPHLIYAIMLIITVLIVFTTIPETHNLPVPQTIEQAVTLVIHKEQEWKAKMILQAEECGMDHKESTSVV